MSSQLQLQTNNKTFLGRYWIEHSVLRRYLPSDLDLSILSFGCSTGEELATIRALFPAARLFGCDTDWHNLQTARALMGESATIFSSSDSEVMRHGPYNIILCNSVLLRSTTSGGYGKRGIDPDLWTAVVAMLDSTLRPGGVLQIINSNIPFRYHPLAAGYLPLRSALTLGSNFVDQFDLQGQHMCSGVSGAGWSAVLSRHLAEEKWSDLRVTDLHDVHFWKRCDQDPPQPIEDEIIPNMPQGETWASGIATYRPEIAPESQPSTYVEVDVAWRTVGVESVRLDRTARRIWFDGSVALTNNSALDITGAAAATFIEAATGRRSTRLSLDEILTSRPIRSESA